MDCKLEAVAVLLQCKQKFKIPQSRVISRSNLILLVAICSCLPVRPASPEPRSGQFRMTPEESGDSSARPLSGEWDFFPGVFLDPSTQTPAPSRLNVPGSWGHSGISDEGYASYRLRILGVPDTPMAIRLGEIETAYRLFANGKEIATAGVPGISRETSRPLLSPRYVQLPPAQNGVVELVLHISNFHYREGGIWEDILIGPADLIFLRRTAAVAFEMFMLGSLMIIGLYHVIFYAIRSVERSTLLFGAFCLLFALRISLTGERLLPSLLPLSFWETCMKVEYLTFYLGVPIFAYYQRSLFPGHYARNFARMLLAVSLGFSLIVLVTPSRIFSHTVAAFQAITLVFAFYSGYSLVVATIRKQEGAAIYLLSGAVFLLAVTNDILFLHGVVQTGILAPVGIFSFVLAQALFFAYRFSRSFLTVEHLTRKLYAKNLRLERAGATLDLLLQATKEMAQSGNAREAASRATGFLHAAFAQRKREVTVRLLRLGREDDASIKQAPVEIPETNGMLHLDLTASRGGVDYAVLRLDNLSSRPGRVSMELARGLTDSLALVLENMYHARDEKLATLGSLATEIIHDLKNHTLAIKTFASVIEDPLLPERERKEAMEYVRLSADQMSGLIWDILDYARGEMSLNLRPVVLDEWLKEIRMGMEARLRNSDVRLVFDLNAHVKIQMDPDRFRRVVMNLVLNAAEAMPSGGEVLIRSRRQSDQVILEIADSGTGISDEIKEYLFEPFTTIGKRHGTGLGLTVAKHIVEAHYGSISHSPREGGGSIFSISLNAN